MILFQFLPAKECSSFHQRSEDATTYDHFRLLCGIANPDSSLSNKAVNALIWRNYPMPQGLSASHGWFKCQDQYFMADLHNLDSVTEMLSFSLLNFLRYFSMFYYCCSIMVGSVKGSSCNSRNYAVLGIRMLTTSMPGSPCQPSQLC